MEPNFSEKKFIWEKSQKFLENSFFFGFCQKFDRLVCHFLNLKISLLIMRSAIELALPVALLSLPPQLLSVVKLLILFAH